MISQVGFTMLAPIVICVALAVLLNNRFDTVYFMPVFLLLGIAAAFRNAYILFKKWLKSEGEEEKMHDYIEALKAEGKKKRENKK
ncbi:MAG: AtpZ/AtpI family protein [Lachnospiraceae bacterium]|nr:AtpZ/AtpI family protein [Lachnospiraceae bacterium]